MEPMLISGLARSQCGLIDGAATAFRPIPQKGECVSEAIEFADYAMTIPNIKWAAEHTGIQSFLPRSCNCCTSKQEEHIPLRQLGPNGGRKCSNAITLRSRLRQGFRPLGKRHERHSELPQSGACLSPQPAGLPPWRRSHARPASAATPSALPTIAR